MSAKPREYMPPSAREDWATPPEVFGPLHEEFCFTLDVCAQAHNTKCPRFISPEENGLLQPWEGAACWMNPPYGRVLKDWTEKAHREAHLGATVVALVPARTDTRWFHEHVLGHAEVRFVKGRIKFVGAEHGAPFPCINIVWRPGHHEGAAT